MPPSTNPKHRTTETEGNLHPRSPTAYLDEEKQYRGPRWKLDSILPDLILRQTNINLGTSSLGEYFNRAGQRTLQ